MCVVYTSVERSESGGRETPDCFEITLIIDSWCLKHEMDRTFREQMCEKGYWKISRDTVIKGANPEEVKAAPECRLDCL